MPQFTPRIYWWKHVHTSAIPINHKTTFFLMPHCNWNPPAFHQEMLKWLLEQGREGVWGVNQKYPGLDLPGSGERGMGGQLWWQVERKPRSLSPNHCALGVPRELWKCSEDAAWSMELLHPTCVICADQRVGSSGTSRCSSILINCFVHLV